MPVADVTPPPFSTRAMFLSCVCCPAREKYVLKAMNSMHRVQKKSTRTVAGRGKLSDAGGYTILNIWMHVLMRLSRGVIY